MNLNAYLTYRKLHDFCNFKVNTSSEVKYEKFFKKLDWWMQGLERQEKIHKSKIFRYFFEEVRKIPGVIFIHNIMKPRYVDFIIIDNVQYVPSIRDGEEEVWLESRGTRIPAETLINKLILNKQNHDALQIN